MTEDTSSTSSPLSECEMNPLVAVRKFCDGKTVDEMKEILANARLTPRKTLLTSPHYFLLSSRLVMKHFREMQPTEGLTRIFNMTSDFNRDFDWARALKGRMISQTNRTFTEISLDEYISRFALTHLLVLAGNASVEKRELSAALAKLHCEKLDTESFVLTSSVNVARKFSSSKNWTDVGCNVLDDIEYSHKTRCNFNVVDWRGLSNIGAHAYLRASYHDVCFVRGVPRIVSPKAIFEHGRWDSAAFFRSCQIPYMTALVNGDSEFFENCDEEDLCDARANIVFHIDEEIASRKRDRAEMEVETTQVCRRRLR